MTILQTCGSYNWGGLEMQTVNISEKLSKRGHDVALLCPKKSILEEKANNLGLDVKPLFWKNYNLANLIYDTQKLLKVKKYDVIHLQSAHDLWNIVPAIKLAGYKPRFILTKRLACSINKKDLHHRLVYKHLDVVVSISNFIKKNVIDTCPVDPKKVYTLWNAIDTQKYNPDLYSKNEIRRSLGMDENTSVIGLVGRIAKMKGHKEFIYAAKKILDETDLKVHFIIVGDAGNEENGYSNEVYKLVEELELQSHITFTGWMDNIPRIMAAIDIIAFPSHKESFGNILLEAMAMKVPVVASNSGAVPEIILDGKTGLLVPPKNADMLAKKLMELLQNKSLRVKLGIEGRKRIEQHFLINSYIDELENYYISKK